MNKEEQEEIISAIKRANIEIFNVEGKVFSFDYPEMKSIKEQVIEAYDKHYVSSCAEVVDLTLEKVDKIIDEKIEQKSEYLKNMQMDYVALQGKDRLLEIRKCESVIKELEELKLSLKGGKK